MPSVLGIDPGLTGALAFNVDGRVSVFDMPVLEIKRGGKTKRELDLPALKDIIRSFYAYNPKGEAWVEKAQAMPKQGTSSMFAYGQSYGAVLGILAAFSIPLTKIHPTVWKKKMGVNAGKDGCRQRASEIFPQYADNWPLKKHHGRAEAALIAAYGAQQ